MPEKLIDGNITIEDKASASLSQIESALKGIGKIATPVTKKMQALNKEIEKMKSAPMDDGKIYGRVNQNLSRQKWFKDLPQTQKVQIIRDTVNKTQRQNATKSSLAMKSMVSNMEIEKINARAEARERYFERLDKSLGLRADNRQAYIGQLESLRMARQADLFKKQSELADLNHVNKSSQIAQKALYNETLIEKKVGLANLNAQIRSSQVIEKEESSKRLLEQKAELLKLSAKLNSSQIAEKEASAKRLMEQKAELSSKMQQQKMESKLAEKERKLAESMKSRTDWQKRMDRLAAKGGKLQPLWESFGKATSPLNLARSPHLVTEGMGGVFGKMGRLGKGIGGFATGRMVGGMLGSSTLGGIIGGAVAGPVGIAIASVGTAIIAGFNKLSDRFKEIVEILERTASERATESTSLRRKMQMSSEMFGVEPTNVKEIDKKIYGLRTLEQQYYRKGMSGRDITTSAIDWLHLLGTKESGGVFKDEQQVFDFSAALSAIAKMNGLSDQEYETVRYQGMQILSKGYADILDVKPLLNSAPGFVRDLLQQTGMSRKEFLESGRTHAFTSDKFIDALMGVKSYYEVLSERMSSRTQESQNEAAENIIGAASVWDEMYKKNEAESNKIVANAIMQGGLAEDINKSFYQMFTATNDAEEGTLAKANLEKQITHEIWKMIMYIYGGWVLIKNVVDFVIDGVMWFMGSIGAGIVSILDLLTRGLTTAFGKLLYAIGDLLPDSLGGSQLKEWGTALDANNAVEKRSRAEEDLVDKLTEDLYKTYQKEGHKGVMEKYGYAFEGKNANKFVGYKLGEEANPWTFGLTNRETKTPIYESKPIEDALFFGNEKDKSEQRWVDKEVLRRNIAANVDVFIDSKGNFASSKDGKKSLQEDLGLRHAGVDDYTYMDSIIGRFDYVGEKSMKAFKNDFDDITRTLDSNNRAIAQAEEAMADVKAPYVEKIAKDVKDIKNAQGSGNAKILDVLKEIAGITVINKVTRVRPDVVFNFGSYGRNGKKEDENLRAVGDRLNSFYNDEQHKVSINGVPVLNEDG